MQLVIIIIDNNNNNNSYLCSNHNHMMCLLFTLDLASVTQCYRITGDGDGAALTLGVVTSIAIRNASASWMFISRD